jgi:D-alanine--poly(phosphoribitol) ligase subunit 1
LPTGCRVAILGVRDPLAYAAVLGVLRSGRSYVPLHPDHPEERWRQALEQAEVQGIIAPSAEHERWRARTTLPLYTQDPAPTRVRCSGAEAYVMFTSGSTGGPKGVQVTRANVAAYLQHALQTWDIRPEDRCTQLFALGFDLSVHDLFVCWGKGACLCVPEEGHALRLASYLKEERITVWFSVPSVVGLMQRMRALAPGSYPLVRISFFCGEALPWSTTAAWAAAAPNSSITNLYGPTEATIAILEHPVHPPFATAGTVPLGKPFPGASVHVENDGEEGDMGQLWLGGPQVALGYVQRPETTDAVFRTDANGVRWYATGDRVRKDDARCFHFLGRMDDQVKVQGHRVEPSEVDRVLGMHLGAGQAVTVAVEGTGGVRLVTFIDVPGDTVVLMHTLKQQLPPYMLPEAIHILEHLPLNANGKVDKRALKELADHG